MPSQTELLIQPHLLEPGVSGEIVSVTPERAGWQHISFAVRRFRAGERLSAETGDFETVLVILGGNATWSPHPDDPPRREAGLPRSPAAPRRRPTIPPTPGSARPGGRRTPPRRWMS